MNGSQPDEFENAREQLERELQNFLARVLSDDSDRVDRLTQAISNGLASRSAGIVASLPKDLLNRLTRIEDGLKSLEKKQGSSGWGGLRRWNVEVHVDAGALDSGPTSGTGERVVYHFRKPGSDRSWMLALAITAIVLALAFLFVLLVQAGKTDGDSAAVNGDAGAVMARPVEAAVADLPAVERGWYAFLGTAQGPHAQLAPRTSRLLCGTKPRVGAAAVDCPSFAEGHRRWNQADWSQIASLLRQSRQCPGLAESEEPTEVANCLAGMAPPRQ